MGCAAQAGHSVTPAEDTVHMRVDMHRCCNVQIIEVSLKFYTLHETGEIELDWSFVDYVQTACDDDERPKKSRNRSAVSGHRP